MFSFSPEDNFINSLIIILTHYLYVAQWLHLYI